MSLKREKKGLASMFGLGGLTWKELGKRVWRQMNEDDIWGRAAQLSYYFLLALFPLLIFLTSVIGIVMGSGTGIRHSLFNYLSQVMPPSAFKLVDDTMYEVSQSSGGGKISFGILAALWAASNGMGAISDSLNAAYNVQESRPWWRARLVTIGLTVAIALLTMTTLVLILYGGTIAEKVAASYGFGDLFTMFWKILQWPIVFFFILLSFSLIYFFAPDLKDQDWKWVTPGSMIGVGLWLVVSFLFRLYLGFFDSYSATYGSLGAVIILMLWFYLTGLAILIGGEINSEIENAAAEKGAPDAKERGEKAPDENEKATGKGVKQKTTKA
jgi:membrane protein